VKLITYQFPKKPTKSTEVTVQLVDNLPEHIKRDSNLDPEDFKHGVFWDRNTQSYAAQLLSLDDTTSQLYEQTEPVEFIQDQRTRLENWYKLYREVSDSRQVRYYTSIEHIIEGQGIRNWDKFDKRYPQLQTQKPSPTEQILSQGLTQIVSTSRSQPLTPEGPTGALSTIIHNVTNPTNTPVTYSTYQLQTMATQVMNQGEGGVLYGAPPPFFKGESKEANRFLLTFKGWRAVNSKKKTMMNPYSRVALILTFIDREDVQDWKEHQLDLLNEQITNGHAQTEEYLWNEFEWAFKVAFKDSSKVLNAQTQLNKLQQDREGIKQYIVKFNHLLKQAKFDKDDKGLVNLFRKGLIPTLHESCIRSQPQPVSMQQWQDTAKKEHQIFQEIQHIRFQQGLGQPIPVPKQKVQQNPTRFWRAPGPNAMNVNLTTTTDPNLCLCYNCQKPGHIKANCQSPRVQQTNT
jgi:Retrotransposon gag protein/Zinc knuckle